MEAETCAASFGIRVEISLQLSDSGRPSHVLLDLIGFFFGFFISWIDRRLSAEEVNTCPQPVNQRAAFIQPKSGKTSVYKHFMAAVVFVSFFNFKTIIN